MAVKPWLPALFRDMDIKPKKRHGNWGRSPVSRRKTDEQVRRIRKLYAKGGWTHRGLAKKFNCSKTNIGSILNREIFKLVR